MTGSYVGKTFSVSALLAVTLAATASAQNFFAGGSTTTAMGSTDAAIQLATPTSTVTYADLGTTGQVLGMAVDPANDIYVAANSGNVYRVDGVSRAVTNFATGLTNASDIALDASGNVYVADSGAGAIYKYSSAGGMPTTIATGLNTPEAITFDLQGNLYIAEDGSIAVLAAGATTPTTLVSNAGDLLTMTLNSTGTTLFASTGTGIVGFNKTTGAADNTYSSVSASDVGDMTFDASGNLYLGEIAEIVKVLPNGTTSNYATVAQEFGGFVLTDVPEPGPTACLALGAAGLLLLGWRRRRCAV